MMGENGSHGGRPARVGAAQLRWRDSLIMTTIHLPAYGTTVDQTYRDMYYWRAGTSVYCTAGGRW